MSNSQWEKSLLQLSQLCSTMLASFLLVPGKQGEMTRLLLQNLQDGLAAILPDRTLYIWNARMADITGRPAVEVLGRDPADIWPAFWTEEPGQKFLAALDGASSEMGGSWTHHTAERKIQCSCRFDPVRDEHGHIRGAVFLVHPEREYLIIRKERPHA